MKKDNGGRVTDGLTKKLHGFRVTLVGKLVEKVSVIETFEKVEKQ